LCAADDAEAIKVNFCFIGKLGAADISGAPGLCPS